MKQKYKLGTLVAFFTTITPRTPDGQPVNGATQYGEISEVTQNQHGYSYRVGELDGIAEENITKAYKPIATRKVASRKSTKQKEKRTVITARGTRDADEATQ